MVWEACRSPQGDLGGKVFPFLLPHFGAEVRKVWSALVMGVVFSWVTHLSLIVFPFFPRTNRLRSGNSRSSFNGLGLSLKHLIIQRILNVCQMLSSVS